MFVTRRYTIGSWRLALALCALGLLISSCGLLGGGGPEKRAAQYYNYMAGKRPGDKYSSYLSPGHRSTLGREGVKTLDEAKKVASKPNERYPDAKAADVSVSQDGHFAITMVNPELGDAFRNMPPVRWVRDGSKWYVFSGSESEVGKYGPFPETLAPREPPGSAESK